MRATLTLLTLAVLPALAQADVLVRHCETPAASGCTLTPIWVLPANATNVQVNRAGAPFVKLSDVQPSERIAACYDDPGMQPGSTTVCAARVPGRTDLWQLKSVLYPAAPPPPKSLQLTIDASSPKWDSGAPLASNQLADLSVRLYGAPAGQLKTLLDSMPWSALLTFRRISAAAERWCFSASFGLDTTGDGVIDQEGPQTPEWCGTFADPVPVLHLTAPNSITGQAPAP